MQYNPNKIEMPGGQVLSGVTLKTDELFFSF